MQSLKNSKRKIPLNLFLLIPLLILSFSAVAAVGYLSFTNGQKAVNDLAYQLRFEINERINDHLNTFLKTPQQIISANIGYIKTGLLDSSNQEMLMKHFLSQVQSHQTVTSISFGNTQGGIANAGREGAGEDYYFIFTADFSRGHFYKYAIDNSGEPLILVDSIPNFDSTTRDWYVEAMETESAVWSDVYILFTGQDLSLSASQAVYDNNQNLLGVVAVNLFLSHLEEFLASLNIIQNGQSLIVESSGNLIASSKGIKPFENSVVDNTYSRKNILDNDGELSQIAQPLIGDDGNIMEINETYSYEFYLEDELQFGMINSLQSPYGLDWLILTVIPEKYFMSQIRENNRNTFLLMGITMLLITIFSVFITKKIIEPIVALSHSAQALAKGEWLHTSKINSSIVEIDQMIFSFNRMAKKLEKIIAGLKTEILTRKKAEEKALESEERFKVLYKESPVSIAVHDIDSGEIIDANDLALKSFNCKSLAEYKNRPSLGKSPYSILEAKQWIDKASREGLQIFLWKSVRKVGEEFWEEVRLLPIEIDSKKRILAISADITQRIEAEKKVEFLSFHDVLTGLYNRRFFEEEFKRLDVERNLPICIIIIDVNGLKLVNDAFGHAAGNSLLVSVANTLQNELRADEIVARIGGDEFAILLPNINAEEVHSIIKRLQKNISKKKIETLPISVACGWAIKTNQQQNLSDIFKLAEDNMVRDKIYDNTSHRHQSIQLIMQTLYEKTPREQHHSQRVSELCHKFGQKLGLPHNEINELTTAGLLHDIGKIAISNDILNKNGSLNQIEWQEILKHPEVGYSILSSVSDYANLAEYVKAHHEKWDGTGYPKGLKGQEIPLLARAIAIADAYDAMTSTRSYRRAMSKSEAIVEIEMNTAKQFDPYLAKLFIELIIDEETL